MKLYTLIPFLFFLSNSFAQPISEKPKNEIGVYNTFQFANRNNPEVTPQFWLKTKKVYCEARYNYEDSNTLSLYFGKPIELSKKKDIELIPMIGGVIGISNGLSIAFSFQTETNNFTSSTQCNYFINKNSNSNNYLFDWSSITYKISKIIGVGGGLQITIPENNYAIIKSGPMASLSFNNFTIEMYGYNLWEKEKTFSIGLEYSFKK